MGRKSKVPAQVLRYARYVADNSKRPQAIIPTPFGFEIVDIKEVKDVQVTTIIEPSEV